ncbi:MAG TPA: DapH/DapD/GlmU-related protein [Verrucomicrobiae bacterium]|nr:DapH/DapD/GlmU-related protein [Verrucomicrobiae bacterium]
MNITRVRQFIVKYDFPAHLFVLFDIATAHLSTLFWTLRTKLLLRLLGCSYGRNLRVDGHTIIRVARRGAIRLGENVVINSRSGSNLVGRTNPTILHCMGEGRIEFGDNSGCSFAVFSSKTSIRIGNYTKIGGNARIYDHDYHALDPLSRRSPDSDIAGCKTAPVTIGDDVLIGANAIILKGVTVGDRSVIGAGAVVSLKDIPSDSLVAGNPAHVIRKLNHTA